jgi:hypothetical protein
MITDADGSFDWNTMPGQNLMTVFMNDYLTFEDAFIMSRSAISKFRYKAYHFISLSMSEMANIRVGCITAAASR